MNLHTVYQPIVNLKTNNVLGYESLLRGPLPPLQLFDQAAKNGKLIDLDSEAQEMALSAFSELQVR